MVAIWGLTYKPGTDTLRRSSAVELCRRLAAAGAKVRAHDPAVSVLPADLASDVELLSDPVVALQGADALVVCTPWPDYRRFGAEEISSSLANPLIIDPAGALQGTLGDRAGVRYVRVGSPSPPDAGDTAALPLSRGMR